MRPQDPRSPLPADPAGDEDILDETGDASARHHSRPVPEAGSGSPLPQDLARGEDELRPGGGREGRPDQAGLRRPRPPRPAGEGEAR